MGVRGLTTYIARHAERYLDPFELHDTALVIDGDNLCIQIFMRSQGKVGGPFGGNYDNFYRSVLEFFDMLKQCNVTSYVLLDGGYDKHKLRTVRDRLLGRIGTVKFIQPGDNRLAIPLMMREVFVDALKAYKIKLMRCMFEADNEIAILARKLNCPVLSYDSDFYIHNVHYIPFITLTLKVYKKTVEDEKNYEIEIIEKKKMKNKKVVVSGGNGAKTEAPEQSVEKKAYCYMDCCLYTIENLIIQGKLEKEMLPLFATLIGNDYIERKLFRKFYSQIKVGKIKKKMPRTQKKIIIILDWLRQQTIKSAIRVILKRVKEDQRENLIKQIQAAMCGYNYEKSIAFEYFGFEEVESKMEDDGFNYDYYFNLDGAEDTDEEDECSSDEDDEEEEEEGDDEEEEDEEDDASEKNEEDENEELDEIVDEPIEGEEAVEDHKTIESKAVVPPWLARIYQNAETPRFVVDLFFSRLYINYPQIEDIMEKADSNEISYDILKLIFALLKCIERDNSFTYITRMKGRIRYYFKAFENVRLPPQIKFDPECKRNVKLFQLIFKGFDNSEVLFKEISNFPENLRLYFLSIIYWLKNCETTNAIHLNSLITCLIQISFIDKKIGSRSRDVFTFHKNQDRNLTELKAKYVKSKDIPESFTLKTFKELNRNVSKNEAHLAYENLISHFALSDKFLRKHSEFERSVVHTFAEFQSVAFNMYTITPLLNYPYENIKIHECYNGLFIYNCHQNFKSRSNILEYLQRNVYQFAPNLFKIHKIMYDFCVSMVPEILERNKSIKVKTRKRNKVKKVVQDDDDVENDCVIAEDNAGDSNDEEFVDVNNAFYKLMQIK